MTSKGLVEMFEGDFAETCVVKFPLLLMGGQADPSSVRIRGARTHQKSLLLFKQGVKMVSLDNASKRDHL